MTDELENIWKEAVLPGETKKKHERPHLESVIPGLGMVCPEVNMGRNTVITMESTEPDRTQDIYVQ
jgi:hypothetical protein